jgi:hypothetical protein
MSSGKLAFRAFSNASAPCRQSVSKLITCPMACTPLSVRPAPVMVNILLRGRECVYTVENSKLGTSPNANGKSGIGLQNVQRRLELSYPEDYNLEIDDSPDRYKVQLKILLT